MLDLKIKKMVFFCTASTMTHHHQKMAVFINPGTVQQNTGKHYSGNGQVYEPSTKPTYRGSPMTKFTPNHDNMENLKEIRRSLKNGISVLNKKINFHKDDLTPGHPLPLSVILLMERRSKMRKYLKQVKGEIKSTYEFIWLKRGSCGSTPGTLENFVPSR